MDYSKPIKLRWEIFTVTIIFVVAGYLLAMSRHTVNATIRMSISNRSGFRLTKIFYVQTSLSVAFYFEGVT